MAAREEKAKSVLSIQTMMPTMSDDFTRGSARLGLGLGLVKICFVVGFVFGFFVMFCFVC